MIVQNLPINESASQPDHHKTPMFSFSTTLNDKNYHTTEWRANTTDCIHHDYSYPRLNLHSLLLKIKYTYGKQ